MRRVALRAGFAFALAALAGAQVALAKPPRVDPDDYEAVRLGVPPPGGKLFGFHEEAWSYPDPAFDADRAAEVAALAGGNSIRFAIDWRGVEPQRDDWNEVGWGRAQSMYDALVARGMLPIITIGFAPTWARDVGAPQLCFANRGCEYPPAAGMLGEWREFAAEVARRFPRAAIELWNEPNLVNFWKPYPDPERYAALAAAAHEAIKAANPGATVLGGSLASSIHTERDASGNVTVMPIGAFLDRAYEATPGIRQHMDAISFHMVFQQSYMGKGSTFAKAFAAVRRSRAAHGDRDRRLWITESGLSTSGEKGMTAREQAETFVRQYRRVLTMRDVDAFLIHTLYERYDVPADDPARGHGVTLSLDPLRPKRAFCEFANRARAPRALTNCAPGRIEPFPRLWRKAKRCTEKLVGLRRRIMRAPGDGRGARARYDRRLRACVERTPGGCASKLRRLERRILVGPPEREPLEIARHERAIRRC